MDEQRIEDALRAGSPDEPPYPEGAFARALAEREGRRAGAVRFGTTTRSGFSMATAGFVVVAVVVGLVVVSSLRPGTTGTPGVSLGPGASASAVAPGASAPSTPPGASSSSAASPAPSLPTALVDRWVGLLRSTDGVVTPPTRAVLDFRGAEVRVGPDNGRAADQSSSAVTAAGPGELLLTAIGATGGCQPYDEGRYRWGLSPESTTLTLELVRDACTARGAVLGGDWWHTSCRDPGQDCLGSVEAGTYASMALDLDGSGHAAQLKYAVPEGWANSSDHPQNYSMRPAADYLADPGFDGNDTVSGIYVWAGTLAAAQPADCAGAAAPGVSSSAAAIADYLVGLPGLAVDDQGTMTIDGRAARVLDLSLDPGYTGTCPWAGGAPFRSLITFGDAGPDRGVQGLAEGERARVILLDIAPGRVASIWVDGGAAQFESLVAEAMPIIETFRFPAGAQP